MTRDEDERFEEEIELDSRGRRTGRRVLVALVVAGLVAAGAGVGVIWGERRATDRVTRSVPDQAVREAGAGADRAGAAPGAPPASGPSTPAGQRPGAIEEPVEVTLPLDAVQRAGIKTSTVTSRALSGSLVVPGTVSSNAYRETRVSALVGGIAREVRAELGAAARRGDTLAIIFSPDLADAQMRYLSMRAMLQADHQKRLRTERLAEIGAASRQELEEIVAAHDARQTELAAAGQRLLLLGLTVEQLADLRNASQVVSDVAVPAPVAGVVLTRAVNPGQVITAGQDLFTVADLSTVWVIGDVYEKDLRDVRVGTEASVRLPDSPGAALPGRIAYIDPRVDPATRTAKVRVEVPNRRGALKLGMYVTLDFRTGFDERVAIVPRSALQTVNGRSVVYVPIPDEEGRFVERAVTTGAIAGDTVQVLSGVKPGDQVVSEGSFFLRAEAARTR